MKITLEFKFRLLHDGECFCLWVINIEILTLSQTYTLLHKNIA